MQDTRRKRSSVLWGLCCVTILTGSISPGASAQDTNARGTGTAVTSAVPLNIPPYVSSQSRPASRPATPQRYFIEFRSRTAQSYGHTFVVHGPITDSNTIHPSQVAGLHPAGSSPVTYLLGHILPVPAETGYSYGDTDEQYLTARYRVEMDGDRYQRVAAFIKDLQARAKIWTATQYNCNAFAGEIAQFMGLQTPNTLEYPEDYINGIRRLNSG